MHLIKWIENLQYKPNIRFAKLVRFSDNEKDCHKK